MVEMIPMTALWWAVVASGLFHGLSPGMGWPLAVSAALMERRAAALPRALAALAVGHLGAMLVILLPFSVLIGLVAWAGTIQVGAALVVIAMGVWLLVDSRHPRFLARVKPSRLTLWSFLIAMAHGAGLMLVPIYLGICAVDADAGHKAAETLMGGTIVTAFAVALVHTLAMTVAGAAIATAIYVWLGLKFLTSTWFNLDAVWALSLILVGAAGLYGAVSHEI